MLIPCRTGVKLRRPLLDEAEKGMAWTARRCRFGASAGGAPPRHASEQTYGEIRLSSRSEESPRALRQRVPALTVRSPRQWGHGDGLVPEVSHAADPAAGNSDACRGPSGPLNRTGLTLAVSHTQASSLLKITAGVRAGCALDSMAIE